ncbi:MarR family transcriptional regulator (plasmid) [Rhodococcus pseudokoreensis]|uniref:MarR family transcriptional regulator n=2 Tax=Rhodococcus TaxID=1827 RepID=A0ABT4NQ49_RHOOP|nr:MULTISPECIES: MarR family transcriptional regulator [Rhodococcus]MCZ4588173.1 MarR family transcriptional regulator [Rhodococcus opacus]QSE87276.1 MarR family transcriptional regulator [Rhodococcus pseudokoreensis]
MLEDPVNASSAPNSGTASEVVPVLLGIGTLNFVADWLFRYNYELVSITMGIVGENQVRQRRGRGSTAPKQAPDGQWADFADLVLTISREIKFGDYSSEEAVSLSPSEGVVMRYLHRHPGSIPSRVAHASGLQRSNLSTVLRGLEDRGLIERRSGVDDAREVQIFPTARGTSNYALVRTEWAELVSAAAGGDADLDAAVALLQRVEAGLVRLRQAGEQAS